MNLISRSIFTKLKTLLEEKSATGMFGESQPWSRNVLLVIINGQFQASWEKYYLEKKLLTAFLHNIFASNGHVAFLHNIFASNGHVELMNGFFLYGTLSIERLTIFAQRTVRFCCLLSLTVTLSDTLSWINVEKWWL